MAAKEKVLSTFEALVMMAVGGSLICTVCLWALFAYLAGTKALPDDVGFGYYEEFNTARKIIENSPCAKSIEYARHEDLTLEDFHFKIRTSSGWTVRLWFVGGSDVKGICSNPAGFVVTSPTGCQAYSVATVSAALAENGTRVADVSDLLCNMGFLAPMFRADDHNEHVPQIDCDDPAYAGYLQVEVVETGRENDFKYTRIR
jgi:hypothetical protein